MIAYLSHFFLPLNICLSKFILVTQLTYKYDKSPKFRKVKIESLFEFEWSIAGTLFHIDKLS